MSEIYFIGGMFTLIMIICAVTVFFFVQTYRREQREKMQRKAEKKSKLPAATGTVEP